MIDRSGRRALVLAVSMVLLAVTVSLGMLVVSGWAPWSGGGQAEAADAAPQDSGTHIAAQGTPARDLVQALMGGVGDQWQTHGRVDGARPPFPLACGDAAVPAASASVTVAVPEQVQFYVAVYGAGMGAAELAAQTAGLRGCASGAWATQVDGPGAEAYQVSSSWNGRSTTARVWRHGDVLLYAVSDHGGVLGDVAARVHEIAESTPELAACVTPTSTAADAARSPLAGEGFTGWLVPRTVSVPEPERTDATDLPPSPGLVEVDRPARPAYPVWPPLPDPVPFPQEPVRPEWPVTTAEIKVAQEDPTGPGCGWAFTGMKPPVFDRAAAQDRNDAEVRAARDRLNDGVAAWGRQLADFWEAWPRYAADAEAYDAYATEVTDTAAAWDVIAGQWRDYEDELARYREETMAHQNVLDARRRLQEEYDAEVARCAAPPVTPVDRSAEETPDDLGADLPADEPTGPATETTPPEEPEDPPARADCPPQRPAVLDEAEPIPPVEPEPPADPRPTAAAGAAPGER